MRELIKVESIDETAGFQELVLKKRRMEGNGHMLLYLESDLDMPFYYLKQCKEERKMRVFMFPHHMDACALNRTFIRSS